MAREGRGLFTTIWNNLVSTLTKPVYSRSVLVGKDRFGNKYYEVSGVGARPRGSRWFIPKGGEEGNFDQEVPPEWEAWLRGRRKAPPTEDEIQRNLTLMMEKKRNAAEIDAKYEGMKKDGIEGKALLRKTTTGTTYPKYEDYEIYPGKRPDS